MFEGNPSIVNVPSGRGGQATTRSSQFKNNICTILSKHPKGAHVSHISSELLKLQPDLEDQSDNLPSRVSTALSTDIKRQKTKSSFRKVLGKNGRSKKGWYCLRRERRVTAESSPQPVTTTQYTGRAGEAAVISELLFFGYNPSAMAVDDGIDIIAANFNRYFTIQVKTANLSSRGEYAFSIAKSSFDRYDSSETFYVFVLRVLNKNRYLNDYLILSSVEVKRLFDLGVIKSSEKFTIRIAREKNGVYRLNGTYDCTSYINKFDVIR
ncbi:MAG: hypothetical protein H6978_00110 [Gammaproteobacteria bacterium]|nr:hypothetical protein [Gammaproteobacteria bacterium]